jgi:hypothetical protein
MVVILFVWLAYCRSTSIQPEDPGSMGDPFEHTRIGMHGETRPEALSAR